MYRCSYSSIAARSRIKSTSKGLYIRVLCVNFHDKYSMGNTGIIV